MLGAVTAVASLALTLGLVTPAQASLSSSAWTMHKLPARYAIGSDGLSPVSCAPGTRFCVVITPDTKNLVNGGYTIGQAALVTRNAGRTWTGHATVPSAFQIVAVSCATTSVCWVTGDTWATGGPAVAETTDGGRQWTDMTPAAWATAQWYAFAINCVSATTCWLAGTQGDPQDPAVAETTDGGATWTTFTNLPAIPQTNSGGTYVLNGISCVSADSCVAVGGFEEGGGPSEVISTTNGGATWSLSASTELSGISQLFSVSCLPAAGGNTTCYATGWAGAADVPTVLVSQDGGATWAQDGQFDDTGWLDSISCASTQNCWAAGAGMLTSLAGTADAGSSWSTVTADTTNEEGFISCPSVSVCVTTADNALWVTSDDGDLEPAA